MAHTRRQTIELALAMLDHLANVGGPLQHAEEQLRPINRELHEYLEFDL